MVKKKFNISNRALYTLIAIGFLAILGFGVYAVTPNPGHDASSIDFSGGVIDLTPSGIVVFDISRNSMIYYNNTNISLDILAPGGGGIRFYRGGGILGMFMTNTGNLQLSQNLSVSGTSSLGLHTVSSTCTNCLSRTVSCPAGERVLGGACNGTVSSTNLKYTRFVNSSSWYCEWTTNSGSSAYSAEATCARIN